MKAKLLPCAVSVFLSLTAGAQEIVKIRTADAPAGGSAEIYGGYETGGFRPGFAASSLWKAGAKAKGTRHGDRTSWTGSFGFEQVEGKDMFTSMFLYPGYYPIDVLEFTPGDKTRQTYSLGGGLVTEPGEDWLLGGKVAYQAANYGPNRPSPCGSGTGTTSSPSPISSARKRKRLTPNRLAARRTPPTTPS